MQYVFQGNAYRRLSDQAEACWAGSVYPLVLMLETTVSTATSPASAAAKSTIPTRSSSPHVGTGNADAARRMWRADGGYPAASR